VSHGFQKSTRALSFYQSKRPPLNGQTLKITRLLVGDGHQNHPLLCWHVTVVIMQLSNSRALIRWAALLHDDNIAHKIFAPTALTLL